MAGHVYSVQYFDFGRLLTFPSLSSFSLGRPFRVDSEEITVAKPNTSPNNSYSDLHWINYPAETAASDTSQPDQATSLVSAQWVSLCEELAPLVRVLSVLPI